LRVERNVVRDTHNYGRLDVSRIIVKSSNVGVSKLALSLPPDRYWQLIRDLGFGTPTDLGFIGEREGYIPHFSGWSKFEYATHSFGYGMAVTVLQLAEAYAVLAADGVKRPLSLLRREQPPEQETRVISAAIARDLRAMLEQVVSKQGTAPKAAVPGYRVGGKTGTVHKVVGGKYAKDRYLSLFAGIAPISRPQLVMVVVVDEPKGRSHYGGQVAAPVFSQVMSGALRLLNVTPDAIISDNDSVQHLAADL
jgi:cell division protein FtsI (penicillin-binding protein 3)